MQTIRLAILQHLKFMEASHIKHNLVYYNALLAAPPWLAKIKWDVIVLDTTLLRMRWADHFQEWKWNLRWLKHLNCLKIALPQDDYDYSEVLDEWLYEWGITAIFTPLPKLHYRETLYPIMSKQAQFYHGLTGYIDRDAAYDIRPKLRPVAERPLDIVYRANHLPYWYGSHAQQKHKIGDIVNQRAQEQGLLTDISTKPQDVILGNQWLQFLASGKAVIGTESGVSAINRRGEIRAYIEKLLHSNPTLTFDQVSTLLPPGWDSHDFFAISPRHFEAVITKTVQILVEGDYSGILMPNTHYIPLKPDYSNLDDVLDKLQNLDYLTEITERAYQDIYLSGKYTYRSLAEDVENIIASQGAGQSSSFPWQQKFLWQLARLSSSLEELKIHGTSEVRQLLLGPSYS